MIRIKPLEADVTGLTDEEIISQYGDLYGKREVEGRIIAEVGFVQELTLPPLK